MRRIGERNRLEYKRSIGERFHDDKNDHATAANNYDTANSDHYASTYDHDSCYDDNDNEQKAGNDESTSNRSVGE